MAIPAAFASGVPVVVGVSPNTGSGAAQTFRFQYSSSGGFGTYQVFNSVLSYANSCSTNYIGATNSLYLQNDAGTGWVGPATPGSSSTLQNSQCTVNLAQSSASVSGSVLTLNLALSFTSSFGGTQNIYAYVSDYAGETSGWQQIGSWQTVSSGSTVLGVSPNTGSGVAQTFSFQYSTSGGFGTYQVFNSVNRFASSCSTNYVGATNSLYLQNDAGTGWMGPATPGSSGTLQNSQCTVNLAQSSASVSGSVLTLNLALSFTSTFRGVQNIYADVSDYAGETSGWQQIGNWKTENGGAVVVGVSPNTGSGAAQTFRFQYSSSGGFGTYQVFNSVLSYANSCSTNYIGATNSLYLQNDAGTGWVGPATPGSSSTLQNSQCTVNLAQSSASVSGSVLTLNLALSFTSSFGGTQDIYAYVSDYANETSGWQQIGTWTVSSAGGGPVPTAINHVIFMMQENRSFDNYFGMLNPYRKANHWNIGDDGNEYDVDGLDAAKAMISNPMDENMDPKDTTTTFTPFKFATTCTDDMSSAWLESYGDVNRYDFTTTRQILMNGFVHNAENEAKNDGFPDTRGKRAMGYFDQGFLNYYYFMASQFAVSDRWFSPVASKTIPNRLATMTGGTTQGLVYDPSLDDQRPQLNTETIFQELDQAGVSWKIYYTNTDATDIQNPPDQMPATTFGYFKYSDNYMYNNPSQSACKPPTQPSSVVGDSSNSYCIDPSHIAPLSQYFTDLQNGALPQFAYIEPGYNDGSDEHPAADVTDGQSQMAKIINAFMGSSSWSSSVFFFSYDEGGGPFDHVPPVPGQSNLNTDPTLANVTPDISSIAVNPDSNPNYYPCQGYNETNGVSVPISGADLNHCDLRNYGSYQDPGWNSEDTAAHQGFGAQLGFRLPNMVISPFTRRHYVSHIPMDHTAIIKFVENRFIGSSAHLTNRDAAQPNLLDFFDFNAVPWATPPNPPTPASASCSRENF